MKHKHTLKTISFTLSTFILLASLTGCASKTGEGIREAITNQQDIALSVQAEINPITFENYSWVELDQLTTLQNFRKKVDETLGIMNFGSNSKNGVIYISTDGYWTGNNTLFNAFSNKEFVNNYWNINKIRSELGNIGKETFSDIGGTDTGILATMNAYFNIFPYDTTDTSSGLTEYLSRGEALAGIVRADTPVIKSGTNKLDELFGYCEYNEYAQYALDNSYFTIDNNSLNAYTYYAPITKAEAVYAIVTRYFPEEYNSLGDNIGDQIGGIPNLGDIYSKYEIDPSYSYQTYSLETCLQHPENGLTEDLYKALVIGLNHGVISNASDWNAPIMRYELVAMLLDTYGNFYRGQMFPVNSKLGKTEGPSSLEQEKEKDETHLGTVEKGEIIEADAIDEVLYKYRDIIDMTDEEIKRLKEDSEGWTFELIDEYKVIAYCEYLNFRSGPSTDYPILRSIPSGTEVHIIAREVDNGWYRVVADGIVGYQCGYYFNAD